ncbi:hypothetical protein SD81_013830 [Tolypothrix campylonemoides VB511288]|nr:hypothetical protein SD81_013830 [Tolypothrix campylonemoides VB511288]
MSRKSNSIIIYWRLWCQWIFATSVSLAIVTAVALSVPPTLAGYVPGCLGPVILGFSQWFILRRHIPKAGLWIVATVLGGIGAFFLGVIALLLTMSSPLTGVTGAAFGGVVLGFAQWFVLRQQFAQARWWLLGSTVALVLGASWFINLVFMGLSFKPGFVGWVSLAAGSGAIGGAIKGGVLVWLLHQSKR